MMHSRNNLCNGNRYCLLTFTKSLICLGIFAYNAFNNTPQAYPEFILGDAQTEGLLISGVGNAV